MNQVTSSIQQPAGLTQKQFTAYIKPIKNQTLQKIISNWLSSIDLKYFQGSSHNYKQHQPLQYKLKFSIQKLLPLPEHLLSTVIPYILYNKFPFLISDLTTQIKLQKNILLKQIYTNQFYNGKWKKQFNFQFTMIFLTKIVSCFIKQYFVELKINQNLEAQCFVILYKVFLGNEVGLKVYAVVAKKYVEKISKKSLKNRQMASNIVKKKDSMITLYNNNNSNNINSNSKGYYASNKFINEPTTSSANSYNTTKQKIIIHQTSATSNNKNKLYPPSNTTLNPKPLKSHKNIDLNPNNIKRRLYRNKISFIKSQSPPQKSTLQIFNEQLKQSLYIDPLPIIQPKKIDIDQFVIQKQTVMKNKYNLLKQQTSPLSFDNFYYNKKNANSSNNFSQQKYYSKQRSNKISSSMQIQLKKYHQINQPSTNSISNFAFNSKESLSKKISTPSFSLINQIKQQQNTQTKSSFLKTTAAGSKQKTNSNQLSKNMFEQTKINFNKIINPSKTKSNKSKYYCLTTTNKDKQTEITSNNKKKDQQGSFSYQKFDLQKSQVRPSYKNKHNTSSFFKSQQQQKDQSIDKSCHKNRNTQNCNNTEGKLAQENSKKPMQSKLKSFFKASRIHNDKQNLNSSSLNLSRSFQSKSSYLVRKPSQQEFLLKRQQVNEVPLNQPVRHHMNELGSQKDKKPAENQQKHIQVNKQPHKNTQIMIKQQQQLPINEKPPITTKTMVKRKQSFTPFKQINSILNNTQQGKDSIFARTKTQNLPLANDYIKIQYQPRNNQIQDQQITVESLVENILVENMYEKLGSYTRTTEEVSTTKLKKNLKVFTEFQNETAGVDFGNKQPFANMTNLNLKNTNNFNKNPQKPTSNKNQSLTSSNKKLTTTTPASHSTKPPYQKLSKVYKLKLKKQQFLSQCKSRDLNLKMHFQSQQQSNRYLGYNI